MNTDMATGDIPQQLAGLKVLAANARWSWHRPTQRLFERLDKRSWQKGLAPAALLMDAKTDTLEELAADHGYVREVRQAAADLKQYLETPSWHDRRHKSGQPMQIAYFSPEYGLSAALPQYAGGLGVLAGDHLKTASDLGLPLVAIGLFYRHGYFRQQIVDDRQQEKYETYDPGRLGLVPCPQAEGRIPLGERSLRYQVWRLDVGRVPLYLLDTDTAGNDADLRRVTDRLYGGDSEHRLHQELLLGIGGVRALRTLGLQPTVFHTNEGHAGFMGLERIRELASSVTPFGQALRSVRSNTVFTTHTPVPAGIDRFSYRQIKEYLTWWAKDCGVPLEELMELGHFPDDKPQAPFNMAVMGLRLAERSNGVSRLHGKVSRSQEMFGKLYPGTPEAGMPIRHVTNGVHAQTWTSPEMAGYLSRHVGNHWWQGNADEWAVLHHADPDELWKIRQEARAAMVAHINSLSGNSPKLDPDILTIGFARRFAPYKQGSLLLSQPERLLALLSGDRPVQFVFAGKAHPIDGPGKEIIRAISQFSRRKDVAGRLVLVENYDMDIAASLVRGCDVWLNTPVRPHEASGTSGQKAILNGVLNLSVLDGWWDEMYESGAGWAIGSRRDNQTADDVAASLYQLLEGPVTSAFYTRDGRGLPHQWTVMMQKSLASIGPKVTAARMLRDYLDAIYRPASRS